LEHSLFSQAWDYKFLFVVVQCGIALTAARYFLKRAEEAIENLG